MFATLNTVPLIINTPALHTVVCIITNRYFNIYLDIYYESNRISVLLRFVSPCIRGRTHLTASQSTTSHDDTHHEGTTTTPCCQQSRLPSFIPTSFATKYFASRYCISQASESPQRSHCNKPAIRNRIIASSPSSPAHGVSHSNSERQHPIWEERLGPKPLRHHRVPNALHCPKLKELQKLLEIPNSTWLIRLRKAVRVASTKQMRLSSYTN